MKKLLLTAILALLCGAASMSLAASEMTIGGIKWTYVVRDGNAIIGGGYMEVPAVPYATTGAIEIPETLGAYPVTELNDYAFHLCSSLTSVKIPASVTKIGDRAFRACSSLTSIEIPSNVVSIGLNAFKGCSQLQTITIPAKVTSIGSSAFTECDNLTEIVIAPLNEHYAFIDGMLIEKESHTVVCCLCTTTGDVFIPSGVREIAIEAFTGCAGVTSITIPFGVTSFGNRAFQQCSGLKRVSIPTSVVNVGARTFMNCVSLSEVEIPFGVTSLGDQIFYGCSGLTSVSIPSSVTSIGNSAFYGCAKLASASIPSSVTSIESYAFSGCSGLASVSIPSSVKSIGYCAFYSCTGLTHVLFKCPPPEGVDDSCILSYPCTFTRNAGAMWLQKVGINSFSGYSTGSILTANVISSSIRENDPMIMDVVYKVISKKPSVKVRVLAFEDGERSFAKVVRPETFVTDTNGVETVCNVGDSVTPNVEHTISWRVSTDYTNRLAKLEFEVLACEGELLPLELMTIPASEQYGKMKISWNAISEAQLFDALLWLYADKDSGLSLSSGVVKNGNVWLTGTNGQMYQYRYDWSTSYYNFDYRVNVARYVFGKMGYSLLTGAPLTYANTETRLGLSPSGARQYAYKIVEE